jgi:archaellum component FlaF (FlaF/FlaG flagellin family)
MNNVIAAIILVGIMGVLFLTTAVWLSDTSESAARQVENQQQTEIEIQGQRIRIVDYQSNDITVTNSGTQGILVEDLSTFHVTPYGDQMFQCSWDAPFINPGEDTKCTVPVACSAGELIKVTAPGNYDAISCI